MTTFGVRLAWAIAASPFDQKQIADKLGVTEGQVSRWCNDRDVPSGRYLLQLPGLLNVDGHWLLTGDGQPERIAESDARARLAEIQQIVTRPASGEDVQPEVDAVDASKAADRSAPPRGGRRGRGSGQRGAGGA